MRTVNYVVATSAVMALLLMVGLGACAGLPQPAPAQTEAPAPAADTPLPPPDTAVPPPAAPEPSPTPTPAPRPSSPHAILEESLQALSGLDTWHVEVGMQMTAQVKGLTVELPVTYLGDFQAPDRLEGTVSVRLLGTTLEKDTVLIARMVQSPAPGADAGMANIQPDTILSLLSFAGFEPGDLRDLELVGEATLDGIPVYHLKGTVSSQDLRVAPNGVQLQIQGEMQFEVWIGVADSLPRQAAAEGELAVEGGAQGTLHVAGTSALSSFGQPVAAEGAEPPATVAVNMPCAAVGSGFISYDDEAEAISFCYPSDWVVDDLVDGCGYFAVSPTGFVSSRQLPEHAVLIYPPATVARFGQSATGAVEVGGQSALCAFRFVTNALLSGKPGTVLDRSSEAAALLVRGLLKPDPIVGLITGIQYGEAKTVAVGWLMDEEAHRPTVEAITYSIVVGPPAAR